MDVHLVAWPDRKVEAARCEVPGCGRSTRHHKPWCPIHVESYSPYALEVRGRLEAYRLELEACDPDPDGLVVEDLLAFLREGAWSGARLARRLGVAPEVVEAYLVAMERWGLVELRAGHRGYPVASLAA